MNMRQHKYNRLALMASFIMMSRAPWQETTYAALGKPHGTVLAEAGLGEAAKVEYFCERVKDGVVVDSFDHAEDAFALVQRHVKQKKAKLVVRNSLTGGIEEPAEEACNV